MARNIDINDRNKAAIDSAKVKTMRALGAIRGVGELSRGYLPLSKEQVDKIGAALEAEAKAAHAVLIQAIQARPEGANTINFDL